MTHSVGIAISLIADMSSMTGPTSIDAAGSVLLGIYHTNRMIVGAGFGSTWRVPDSASCETIGWITMAGVSPCRSEKQMVSSSVNFCNSKGHQATNNG